MTKTNPDSQNIGRAAIEKALRPHVGKGKPHSHDWVCDAADICESTLKSYRSGSVDPGLGNVLALAKALPLSFINTILSEAGMRAIPLDPEEVDHATAVMLADDYHRTWMEAMEDGKIDHIEELRLKAAKAKVHEKTA